MPSLPIRRTSRSAPKPRFTVKIVNHFSRDCCRESVLDCLEIGQGHANGNGGPVYVPCYKLDRAQPRGLVVRRTRRLSVVFYGFPADVLPTPDIRGLLNVPSRSGLAIFGGWVAGRRDQSLPPDRSRVHIRLTSGVHKRMTTTASCSPSIRVYASETPERRIVSVGGGAAVVFWSRPPATLTRTSFALVVNAAAYYLVRSAPCMGTFRFRRVPPLGRAAAAAAVLNSSSPSFARTGRRRPR